MKEVFYFIGVLYLIYEIYYLTNLNRLVEGTYKFIALQKKNTGKSWDYYDKDYKDLLIGRGCPALLFFFWLHVGLFSDNWVFFLGYLLIQYLVMRPLNKLVKYTPLYNILLALNTLLGIAFALFVILNAFHFHIDVTPQVVEFFDNIFN